jgi:hypothetical protein
MSQGSITTIYDRGGSYCKAQKIVGGLIMSVIDFKAAQKWGKIPKNMQELLLNNVFCSDCGVTTIVNYSMHNDKFGVLLKGKCKKCNKDVARLVEDA